MSRNSRQRGFTLGELLAVVGIIASIAAIVFPAFSGAVRSARRTVCLSNIAQLGKATALYMLDNDDRYPYAVNSFEELIPGIDLGLGRPSQQGAELYPKIVDVLRSYVGDPRVWICPRDSGRSWGTLLIAEPFFYPFNGGTSYLFMDLVRGQTSEGWTDPARQGYASDASGKWHSPDHNPLDSSLMRWNVLFYDWHVENIRVSNKDGKGPTWVQ